jgi:hypothetical protein
VDISVSADVIMKVKSSTNLKTRINTFRASMKLQFLRKKNIFLLEHFFLLLKNPLFSFSVSSGMPAVTGGWVAQGKRV